MVTDCNHNEHSGTALYCDCCDHKKMALLKPQEGLEIRDDRHTLAVAPAELLHRLAGTASSAGVLRYVKMVIGG